VDGLSFEDGNSAANFQINGSPFANQGVTLNPATDAARAAMIRDAVYDTNINAAVSGVASGTYSVYLYMWEDNNPVTLNITLEGQTVQSNYSSGSGGHWDRLGPFTANVTDGTINIGTVSSDNNNLSGIEIWKQTAGTTAPTTPTTPTTPTAPSAPTVSLSAPSTGIVGTALNLTASAASTNGTITKVEFFNGVTKLGEDLTAPYSFSYTPTAAGTLSLTARATNNAAAATTSAAASVTVTAPATTTPPTTTPPATTVPTFVRAVNLGGGAITLDGKSWAASASATNFRATGLTAFANQNVPLTPATDATRASMIRASMYGSSTGLALSGVSSGTYSVYLYVWEDNGAETFNITLEGKTVLSGYNSGSAGHWDRLGPFTANVTDGTVNVGTTGGMANISGIELWKQATPLP
jgi:chitinase